MPGFADQIQASVDKFREKAGNVVQQLSQFGLDGVVTKSPVLDGDFKASWRVGINRIIKGNYFKKRSDAKKKGKVFRGINASRVVAAKQLAKIPKCKLGDRIYISNIQPYGKKIERGSSKQAPTGVVKLTVAQMKAAFPGIVAAERGRS